jgi:hypothetical protein
MVHILIARMVINAARSLHDSFSIHTVRVHGKLAFDTVISFEIRLPSSSMLASA